MFRGLAFGAGFLLFWVRCLTRCPRCATFSLISTAPTPSAMFRVSQEIDFCYGHRLLHYSEKCRHLHGHNGRAVIVMEGAALDSRGMLVDFANIKQALRTWIDEHLDHRMILCRDDPALPLLATLGEPVHVILTIRLPRISPD